VSSPKFLAIMLAVVLAIVLGAVGIGFWIDDRQSHTCAALGAHRVSTGRGNYLCISPDGRVVGP
jgi:hypothetical protein